MSARAPNAVAPADVDEIERLVAPVRSHDDLSFEELAASYNFDNVSFRARVLVRLIRRACGDAGRPLRILDIGCGHGIEREPAWQRAIRKSAGDYWGVEPDTSVSPEPGLFDHVQHAPIEEARLPENHFDLAYSYMVMEHVENPAAFMSAVYRALRPGGVYLFVTPNRRHYFTRVAVALRAVRLEEVVLRLIGAGGGEEYHYPVRYRFNDERTVARCAVPLGFEEPEFAYVEELGPRDYFPRPLRFIFWALVWKRRVIRSPKSLLTMFGRIRKPPFAADAATKPLAERTG